MAMATAVLLSCLICLGGVTSVDKVDANIILQHMQHNYESYDARLRPLGQLENGTQTYSEPVRVTVNIYMRTISNIDHSSMTYDMQLTFRESWKDPRLAFDHLAVEVPKFVTLTETDQIWRPDTFFQNEFRSHRHVIDKPNTLIRIYADGTVLYSVRLTLTLSCLMRLVNYPMDKQVCFLDFASYAYTTDDIVYDWKMNHPIQQKEGLRQSLPTFDLMDVTPSDCTSITNTGSYSCLRAVLNLTRQFSYYLLQFYIPAALLVIVSWVSFWIDRTAVAARVTLGVTALLTLFIQAGLINSKLPPVSYIKAIDMWIGVCVAFIFGAILESASVSYVASRIEQRGKKDDDCLTNGCKKVSEDNDGLLTITSSADRWQSRTGIFRIKIFAKADETQMIDVTSRICFPVAFLLFNLIYWKYYYSCYSYLY